MSEKTYIGKSKIQGRGLIAGIDLSREDGFIGVTHEDNWPTSDMGQFYNHSDTPNARVSKIGNKHYIVPIDKIPANEEITVDYRKQKELEQPETFKFQNGGNTVIPGMTNPLDQYTNQAKTFPKVPQGFGWQEVPQQTPSKKPTASQVNKQKAFDKSFAVTGADGGPIKMQNGGPATPSVDLSNQNYTYNEIGLVPGTPEFEASPGFVQKGNKSFHYNPSNEINVMGTNREAEPRYKRTLGDMMYDTFHPNKKPQVRMKFQNGGSVWDVSVGDTLGGHSKANISTEEWDRYKSSYSAKNPSVKIPGDAYISQNQYDNYLESGNAIGWEAPVKQPPQKAVSTDKAPLKLRTSNQSVPVITTPTPAPVVETVPVEKKPARPAGEIVLPGSTTEWTQAYPGGPKYPKQRAATGATYNLKTGS